MIIFCTFIIQFVENVSQRKVIIVQTGSCFMFFNSRRCFKRTQNSIIFCPIIMNQNHLTEQKSTLFCPFIMTQFYSQVSASKQLSIIFSKNISSALEYSCFVSSELVGWWARINIGSDQIDEKTTKPDRIWSIIKEMF